MGKCLAIRGYLARRKKGDILKACMSPTIAELEAMENE